MTQRERIGPITIGQAVPELLTIVARLRASYPRGGKAFTLDGRLVGDIGEVLVASAYDVQLFDTMQKHHDGHSGDGRRVQIKATMKKSLTFPVHHVPDRLHRHSDQRRRYVRGNLQRAGLDCASSGGGPQEAVRQPPHGLHRCTSQVE